MLSDIFYKSRGVASQSTPDFIKLKQFLLKRRLYPFYDKNMIIIEIQQFGFKANRLS